MADLSTVLRLMLVVLFATSSIGKLLAYRRFVAVVADYALLPARGARAVGISIPWLELIVAALLALNIAVTATALFAAGIVTVFTVAVVVNVRHGRAPECGCFGAFSAKQVSWGTVVRDALFLVLCLLTAGTSILSQGYAFAVLYRPFTLLTLGERAMPSIGFVVLLLLALTVAEEGVRLEQVRASRTYHPLKLLIASQRLRKGEAALSQRNRPEWDRSA